MRKGRPPKFQEPRRPVTVTLPESTLAKLAAINPDRAQAIVKATHAAMPRKANGHKRVELVEVMPGLGVLIVGPSRYLQKIKWLRLVELAPMRYLLVVPSGTAIDSLEVAIIDLLENLEPGRGVGKGHPGAAQGHDAHLAARRQTLKGGAHVHRHNNDEGFRSCCLTGIALTTVPA